MSIPNIAKEKIERQPIQKFSCIIEQNGAAENC